MTAPVRYSTTRHASDRDAGFARWDMSPGEPIVPVAARRGRALLGGFLVLAIAGAGGWAYLDPQSVEQAKPMLRSAVAWATKPAPGPSKSDPSKDVATGLRPLSERLPAPAQPEVPAGKVATNAEAGTEAPAAPSASEPPQIRTLNPPPSSPPGETYAPAPRDLLLHQKRAEAVGLHPDLSRVLLDRLSAVDFKNAGHAVQTALAETADDDVYVWPRQRKPEQALFRVHFVPGAATDDCRRYVVTVMKDGWSTTALPMEKCGVRRVQARRG